MLCSTVSSAPRGSICCSTDSSRAVCAVVQTDVDENGDQPASAGGGSAQVADTPDGDQEAVLDGVVGVRAMSEHGGRHGVQAWAMTLQQHAQAAHVAGLRVAHERGVIYEDGDLVLAIAGHADGRAVRHVRRARGGLSSGEPPALHARGVTGRLDRLFAVGPLLGDTLSVSPRRHSFIAVQGGSARDGSAGCGDDDGPGDRRAPVRRVCRAVRRWSARGLRRAGRPRGSCARARRT
jgi:hypothetical protein